MDFDWSMFVAKCMGVGKHFFKILRLWWCCDVWYVLRSPLHPLSRACIFDASISCSKLLSALKMCLKEQFFLQNPHIEGFRWVSKTPASWGSLPSKWHSFWKHQRPWFSSRIRFLCCPSFASPGKHHDAFGKEGLLLKEWHERIKNTPTLKDEELDTYTYAHIYIYIIYYMLVNMYK